MDGLSIPADSNWFTIGALVLVAVIYLIRNWLPVKGSPSRKEVRAEVTLATEDREILREMGHSVEYLRAEVREVKETVTDLLIASRIASGRGRRTDT